MGEAAPPSTPQFSQLVVTGTHLLYLDVLFIESSVFLQKFSECKHFTRATDKVHIGGKKGVYGTLIFKFPCVFSLKSSLAGVLFGISCSVLAIQFFS